MSETPPTSPADAHVIDVGSETFVREIIERSSTVPVVVDFWADWCGPCRMLGPVLEKLAHEYGGKFVLARVDIDRNPDVAGQFGVRSIPAVFGVRRGAVADAFVGVQPESAIRSWIDRLLPTEAESLVAEARRLEASDPGAAEAKYGQALALQQDLAEAEIGLARIALAQGRIDDATARDGRPRTAGLSRARGREAQGRADSPHPGPGGQQRRGRPIRPGGSPRRPQAQARPGRGPRRRCPVSRSPGPLPRTGRARSQRDRRTGPPDHGRHFPALAPGR